MGLICIKQMNKMFLLCNSKGKYSEKFSQNLHLHEIISLSLRVMISIMGIKKLKKKITLIFKTVPIGTSPVLNYICLMIIFQSLGDLIFLR